MISSEARIDARAGHNRCHPTRQFRRKKGQEIVPEVTNAWKVQTDMHLPLHIVPDRKKSQNLVYLPLTTVYSLPYNTMLATGESFDSFFCCGPHFVSVLRGVVVS